jgi:malate permease and related proteins
LNALLLLPLCLLLGVAVARLAKPPSNLAAGINWWVVNIALPALVLAVMPAVQLQWNLWFLPVSMWLVFGGAWALFALLGKVFGWPRKRVAALTLVCGLGNTAFVGYPLLQALRGPEGVALGAVADQLGCFPMLAVGGAIVTAIYSDERIPAGNIARRVLLFPAFPALIAGMVAGATGGWPMALQAVLARVGDTLVPLALFSVGLQIRFTMQADQAAPIVLALGWKLLLAPLAILCLGLLFNASGLPLVVSVLQAAMAPMISAAILAEQHDLEPRLTHSILALGIVLSLVTVPIADRLLGHG